MAVEQDGGDADHVHFAVNVPVIHRPQLTNKQIDPLQESDSFRINVYLQTLAYVQTLVEERDIWSFISAALINFDSKVVNVYI